MNLKKSVHISNIDYSVTKDDLSKFIKSIVGKDEELKIKLSRKNATQNNGWANVEFSSVNVANTFLSFALNLKMNNRLLIVTSLKKSKNMIKLKLTNLNNDITKSELVSFFNQGGEDTLGLKIIHMPLTIEGKNKGYCLFNVPTDKQARAIIYDLDRTDQFGKRIYITRLDK